VDANEFARVSKLGHTIEEDFRNAKSEVGLADYQVRNWYGWHHHVTMSLVTSWCLMLATFIQKNDPRNDRAATAWYADMSTDPQMENALPNDRRKNRHQLAATKCTGKTLPL